MNKAMKTHDIKIIEPWGPYFYNKEVEKREPQVGFDTKKEVHACFRETSLMNYQYPTLLTRHIRTYRAFIEICIHRGYWERRLKISGSTKDMLEAQPVQIATTDDGTFNKSLRPTHKQH